MTLTSVQTQRLAGFAAAVLMAVIVNGGMLWTFDSVAREDSASQAQTVAAVTVLEPVLVIGRRS